MKATRILSCAFLLFLVIGCGSQNGDQGKPDFDPDQGLVANGKGDFASDYLTTIAGELSLNTTEYGNIGMGVYLHGYTIALDAGQHIRLTIRASDHGRYAVYGPATNSLAGKPRFKQALKKGETRKDGTKFLAEFSFSVSTSGTYLVAYGPKYVWGATYRVSAECDNCGFCQNDSDCAADQFCPAQNACTTTGCVDPSEAICQPRRKSGESCQRLGQCNAELVCNDKSICAAWKPETAADDPAGNPNAEHWRCIEDVQPGYYRTHCISASASFDPATGACSFLIYRSPKNRESLECKGEGAKLWIKSVDCVKWTTVTYDVLSSHKIVEDGIQHDAASVMLRLSGGVNASGDPFYALLGYTEDPDYLGANFSHRLNCDRTN